MYDNRKFRESNILKIEIFREKMKLKDGLAVLREYVNEVEPNESFM